jgi:hypothetical protein
MRSEEEEKRRVEEEARSIQRQRVASGLDQDGAKSDDGRASVRSGRSGRSGSPGSRGSGSQGGSSKKVVRKRIVKMMKQGKLVAEKEEILDEEGKVIRT